MTSRGTGYLIGAGPGDPDLLTVRAVRALRESEVVLVDDLVHPDVVALAAGARVLHVGKRAGRTSIAQEVVTRLFVAEVRRGAIAARLKGGDPFVFGRGGEEAIALARAGLRFEIIPGVSAALGASAYAGIPLTHRGVASSVAFVAGHDEARLAHVAADTIVVFMCLRTIAAIARELIDRGRSPATPIALVRGATSAAQEVYLGTLGEVASLPEGWYRELDPALPTLAIVGEVARLADTLAWRGPTLALPGSARAARSGAR